MGRPEIPAKGGRCRGKDGAKSGFLEFFPETFLKQSVKILKLVREKRGLRTMLRLAREGPCRVTEMVDVLDLVQSTCSHHLSLLRVAGVFAAARNGSDAVGEKTS